MNNNHLRYFRALAEDGGYTRTAARLGIAQPTLSSAIRRLEDELGFPLFAPGRKRAVLTPEGETFYEYARGSLELLDKGVKEARSASGGTSRTLSMGVVYSGQNKRWSELVYALRRQYNFNLQINIDQTRTPLILQGLRQGKYDVGFCGKIPGFEDIEFKPLWWAPIVVAVRKDHPLARRPSIDAVELQAYRLATYPAENPIGIEMTRAFKGYSLDVVQTQVDEISLCSLAVANPDLMALIIDTWLSKAFADDLAIIPITGIPQEVHWTYMVYRADGMMSLPGRFFCGLVEDLY